MAGSATASLRPIAKSVGARLTLDSIRNHKIAVPARPNSGRVTVITTLGLPPLAASRQPVALLDGGQAQAQRRQLVLPAYLARLAAAQERAVAAAPGDPGGDGPRRYRILLNGLAVKLPASKLQRLMRMGFVQDVYRAPATRWL